MLEKIMRMYVMSMAYDIRSPMPHLVGPPGCGKSSVVEQLAELLGKELHIINVSRLSPLDVEGVQMPHGSGEDMVLKMLPATFWTSLKEGDILLMDEFLRGFPEVYNSLLDIFTSRRVGAHRLPKVFIIAASNSVTTYDAALEDRLLHLPVTDPRTNKMERQKIANILISELGLLPSMDSSVEMEELLNATVLPTYRLLDAFKKKGTRVADKQEGVSIRKLIGMAQLRVITEPALRTLIDMNNVRAMQAGKPQFVLRYDGKPDEAYAMQARKLRGNPNLTPIQRLNLEMNLQLIELADAHKEERNAVD